jgi:hypothetical protein
VVVASFDTEAQREARAAFPALSHRVL